nr:hypothetical protein [Clostridia bacterium]
YFSETFELLEKCGYDIFGYVDKEDFGVPECKYLGNDDDFLSNYSCTDFSLVNVPDSSEARKLIYEKYKTAGFDFETVISPCANVSAGSIIEEGCVIHDLCNISTGVKLGKCVRVNVMGNIMHDSSVGNYSTVAPNAVILGRCNIDSNCYIGSNSTVLPGINISSYTTVGAGAVVTKNFDGNVTLVGVPAADIKEH